ncbi:RICIN domain-containing protein [Streptomyces sp. NPDC054932]
MACDRNGGANQKWLIGQDIHGRQTLVNQANGYCLDRQDSVANGAKPILWHCNK